MRITTVAVLLPLLSACTSDMLERQVGQPLSQPIEEIGTPYRAFDTASGERAFVWLKGDWHMISGYTNTNLYGKAPTIKDYTTTSLEVNEDKRCRYILFAKPNVAQPIAPEHWTVTSVQPITNVLCY